MKKLIRRILKENFDDFDWVEDIKEFTPAEQFLYDLMSKLTIVESKIRKNWVLYKNENGEFLMADNINTGNKPTDLYIDYNQIWMVLRFHYGLSYHEAMALCVRMLEITHKRKVLTITPIKLSLKHLFEITHKRKVLT